MAACKDCEPGSKRPAPHPGPRCATHNRAVKKQRSQKAHTKRVEAVYSITGEEYAALYESQGGRCYVCQRANGKAKRLSVDHDHSCCDGPTSCGKCVRSLLCSPCNRMLGHVRDDPEVLRRAIAVIRDKPAQAVLIKMN